MYSVTGTLYTVQADPSSQLSSTRSSRDVTVYTYTLHIHKHTDKYFLLLVKTVSKNILLLSYTCTKKQLNQYFFFCSILQHFTSDNCCMSVRGDVKNLFGSFSLCVFKVIVSNSIVTQNKNWQFLAKSYCSGV